MTPKFTWARDLPVFDENAVCPKCANGAVAVIYHVIHADGFPCHAVGRWVLDEHLCRVCQRCGYGWCEATVQTRPARRPELRAVKAETGDRGG